MAAAAPIRTPGAAPIVVTFDSTPTKAEIAVSEQELVNQIAYEALAFLKSLDRSSNENRILGIVTACFNFSWDKDADATFRDLEKLDPKIAEDYLDASLRFGPSLSTEKLRDFRWQYPALGMLTRPVEFYPGIAKRCKTEVEPFRYITLQYLEQDGKGDLAEIAQAFCDVPHLSFRANSYFNDAFAKTVFPSCAPTLRVLDVSNTKITDLSVFSSLTNLTSLDASGIQAPESIECLLTLTKLKTLALGRFSLKGGGWICPSDISKLSKLPELTDLKFHVVTRDYNAEMDWLSKLSFVRGICIHLIQKNPKLCTLARADKINMLQEWQAKACEPASASSHSEVSTAKFSLEDLVRSCFRDDSPLIIRLLENVPDSVREEFYEYLKEEQHHARFLNALLICAKSFLQAPKAVS